MKRMRSEEAREDTETRSAGCESREERREDSKEGEMVKSLALSDPLGATPLPRLLENAVLLYQGAEARLFLVALSPTRLAVLKQRLQKTHIHPSLDFKLHIHRLQQEVRAMARCRKAGVDTPQIFWVRLPKVLQSPSALRTPKEDSESASNILANISSSPSSPSSPASPSSPVSDLSSGSSEARGGGSRRLEEGLILMEWIEGVPVKAVLGQLEDPARKKLPGARASDGDASGRKSSGEKAEKNAEVASAEPRGGRASGRESHSRDGPEQRTDASTEKSRNKRRSASKEKSKRANSNSTEKQNVEETGEDRGLSGDDLSDEELREAPAENRAACGVFEGQAIEHLGAAVGRAIAKMHDANLVHGDLTTSNLLLRSDSSALSCAAWPPSPLCTFGVSASSIRGPPRSVAAAAAELNAPLAAAVARAAAQARAQTTAGGRTAPARELEISLRRHVGHALKQAASHEAHALIEKVKAREEARNATETEGASEGGREQMEDEPEGKREGETRDATDTEEPLNLPPICIIDFGLAATSSLPEDKAVDLYVLERAVESTHFSISSPFLSGLLASYERHAQGAAQTLARLAAVRLRGRKRLMIG
uniref:non-specific serine/threonine protein kinase n=2 Tax=Toxoplasma gondii TaxID=5811 RepID=A0A2T6IIB5_TOXGO|nr:putative protein kinase [Toxoplasma gondii TgCATBr9]